MQGWECTQQSALDHCLWALDTGKGIRRAAGDTKDSARLTSGRGAPRFRSMSTLGEDAREAVPQLIHCLADPSKDVRANAARALGKIGPVAREAVTALAGLLDKGPHKVHFEVAVAMLRMGAEVKPAWKELILALDGKCCTSKQAVADSLANIVLGGDGMEALEALGALERAETQGKCDHTRIAAANALKRIREEKGK